MTSFLNKLLEYYNITLEDYYSLIKVPKLFHSKSVFFISLAYWITASLTSVPGMLMYFYYLIIIIFIKLKPDYEVIKN